MLPHCNECGTPLTPFFLERDGVRYWHCAKCTGAEDEDPVECPSCGKPMRHRVAVRGEFAGHLFWSCADCANAPLRDTDVEVEVDPDVAELIDGIDLSHNRKGEQEGTHQWEPGIGGKSPFNRR